MNIRIANQEDKDTIFQIIGYSFPQIQELVTFEESRFSSNNYVVCETEEQGIVSSLFIVPFWMFYENNSVPVGGIRTVASRPDARYQGYTGKLVKYSIGEMKRKGMVFSPLAPFSYEFYRKYGWEICYDRHLFQMDVNQLRGFADKDYSYKLVDPAELSWTNDLAKAVYSKYTGALDLNRVNIKDKIDWLHRINHHLLLIYRQEDIVGYIIYAIDGDTFETREMVGLDTDAYKAAFHYIYMYNAQVENVRFILPVDHPARFLINELQVNVKLQSDMMMRIVDIRNALEYRTYDAELTVSLVMEIHDEQAEWNDGIWKLDIADGTVSAKKLDQSVMTDIEVVMDIQTLTQLCMGYMTADDLEEMGRIDMRGDSDKLDDMLGLLGQCFPKRKTFMNERF